MAGPPTAELCELCQLDLELRLYVNKRTSFFAHSATVGRSPIFSPNCGHKLIERQKKLASARFLAGRLPLETRKVGGTPRLHRGDCQPLWSSILMTRKPRVSSSDDDARAPAGKSKSRIRTSRAMDRASKYRAPSKAWTAHPRVGGGFRVQHACDAGRLHQSWRVADRERQDPCPTA